MAIYPGFQYGEVHATSYNMEGIAIWMPSENYPITPWGILRSVPLSVTLGFVRYGSYRLKDFGQYIDAVHARLAPFRHIYLQSLGVDPDFQGQGYAGRLLRHMVTRMDAASLPAYLETLEEQSVRLYEDFGFTVANESTIPDTNLTNWAMLREARRKLSLFLLSVKTDSFLWRASLDRIKDKRSAKFDFIAERWPAHLHINLLQVARGTGLGAALMQNWLEQLKQSRSTGCHLNTLVENTRAVLFFESELALNPGIPTSLHPAHIFA